MQVAYIETNSCHCDEQGFEAFVWDRALGELRLALTQEAPILRMKCSACAGTRAPRIAVPVRVAPVAPLTECELLELLYELDGLREQIAHDERLGLSVWPVSLARLDALLRVEELFELEEQIDTLERRGALVWPAMLGRREELRAQARGLLPAAA